VDPPLIHGQQIEHVGLRMAANLTNGPKRFE